MDYQAGYNYGGSNMSNMYYNEVLLTPGMYDNALYDFSDLLNNTPSGDDSQYPNMPGDFQQSGNVMGGEYISANEYPFPAIPASVQPFSYKPTNAMLATAPPASRRDFAVDMNPRPVPVYQSQPHSDVAQAQQKSPKRSNATSNSEVEKIPNVNPGAGDEPKPKRRRGARKKQLTEEQIALRRKLHLERNRTAAQKCRQKKKGAEAETKDNLIKERQENEIAWIRVAAVEDELQSLRNLALSLENSCECEEQKNLTRTGLDAISQVAAKLQAQIDNCNQARSEISPGLIMERSHEGYITRENIPDPEKPGSDGTASRQNSQQPMSPHNTSNEAMFQQPSETVSAPSLLAANLIDHNMRINTDIYETHKSREGSNGSNSRHDSAVDFDSPMGAKKDSPGQEDEGFDDSVYTGTSMAAGPLATVDGSLFSEIFVAG
ncbi:uncharacterized protein RAG0_05314 [Rhynchosporium agropyri]|uniref:BZIP domain-containing protein n=1 Tax=Rhynchosporium agropyri TaxID=914238 RepID=A0A1E1KCM6_9HELO|nr:uncharacterized protein RAG0_05314 [Rhynchosporium agropyri]